MLTAATVAKILPKDKDYTLADTDHLYLRVRSGGGKTWIVRYMIDGRAKVKTIGSYPAMTLAEARVKRDAFLAAVRAGDETGGEILLFSHIAMDWLKRKESNLNPKYFANLRQRLDAYVLPYIGEMSLKEISRPKLVRLLLRLFDSGREETAIRTASLLENIFQHAVNVGVLESSPAQYMATALPSRAKGVEHFRSVTEPADIALVMQALSGVDSFQTRHALQMIAYTFVRVGELLRASPEEIDLASATWTVPAIHMKKRLELVVPLSRQCVELIREILEYNAKYAPRSRFLFPALNPRKGSDRPITEASLLKALKVLCWQRPGTPAMTVHGFRSMASSTLNGCQFNADAIERQLAHVPSGVRGIYNRAQYLDIRRPMMQWYADYLDALRDGLLIPDLPKNVR